MTAVVALDDVHVRGILAGFSLEVAERETVALVGPSGAGKTTALRTLLGFVFPDRGRVRIGGEVVSDAGRLVVPPEARGLGVVFQDLALWPHLTVEGNLAFGLEARRVPREERRSRIAEMLRSVGLEGFERRSPADLSGGERQRVAIARALVLRPRAVLLDEPLANVDPVLRRDLLALFRSVLAQTTTLHVTHDPRDAAALEARIAIVEAGRVVQTGTWDEIARAPATPFASACLEALR
jgi:ABC-type Fe3+/spermidine/putrescine transport system ATPase subunit